MSYAQFDARRAQGVCHVMLVLFTRTRRDFSSWGPRIEVERGKHERMNITH